MHQQGAFPWPIVHSFIPSPGTYYVQFRISFHTELGVEYPDRRPPNDWEGPLETGRAPLNVVSNVANLEGANFTPRRSQQSTGSDS
jgi:hypothetical protein